MNKAMGIRSAHLSDADALLKMLLQLDCETDNMMLEPGERPTTVGYAEQVINDSLQSGSLYLIATDGVQVAGFLAAERGRYRRIQHSAYVVIGILRSYRGQGIGSQFFQALDAWARANGVSRLELTVRVQNENAIRLYQKYGFEVEGTKRNSLRVDGKLVDEFYMAKLI
jgi:RimJ/RimL family protein N-acetyltransferase